MLVKAFFAAALSLALGMVLTQRSLRNGGPFDTSEVGAWMLTARAGAVDADPYTRASLTRSGEIPLGLGEGLKLLARTEDAGRTLDPRCTYRIAPRVPKSRFWTIELTPVSLERAVTQPGRRLRDLGFGVAALRQLAPARSSATVSAGVAALRYGDQLPLGRRRPLDDAERHAGVLPVRTFTRFGELAYWTLAVAVLTALVHAALILSMPSVAERDAYSQLGRLAALGETAALPRTKAVEDAFPYLDPGVATAFCRYDLSESPLRVRAPLGRAGFFSISFHSRRGAVFFALTDRAAAHGKLEAVIATPEQLRALQAADDEDNPSQDLRVVSPTTQGFALVRVFSEEPSLYGEAEEQARALQCVTEPNG